MLCLCLLGLLPPDSRADDANFKVLRVESRIEQGVIYMDARLDLHFSAVAIEALEHGVSLIILLEMDIKRGRKYLWSKNIASIEQRYRLKYHALSDRYLITNINTGINQAYSSLEDARINLGQIDNFPLLDQGLLQPGEDYQGQLVVSLEIEALPAPLRLIAYLSTDWRLSSAPFEWPLQSLND